MKQLFLGLLLATAAGLTAAEIVVDLQKGSDSNAGTAEAPLKNFRAALGKAKPGDTVRLLQMEEPFYATLTVNNISGTPEQPITIDGGFNILTGSMRLQARDVEVVSPGLYKFTRNNVPEPFLWRFFLVFNDKQVRMEQHSKRPCGALKKPEELKPFEWTAVDRKEFYFRLPEGETLESVKVEAPVIQNGVGVANGSQNIVVKNLIVKHFWNDGYNIHHASKNIVFDTVAAIGCGDDGASGHTDCDVIIRNFVSIGNGIGLCHAGNATGVHENLYIEGSDSRDIFMLNKSNTFKNLALVANAPAVSDFGDKGDNTVENAWFYSAAPGARFRVEFAGTVTVKDMEFANFTVLGNLPGATVNADPETVKAKVEAKKAELFALFGEQLPKAIPPAR